MNVLQRSYKIYNFTLTTSTVSLHYLMKTEIHKTAHFEVSCRSILFQYYCICVMCSSYFSLSWIFVLYCFFVAALA